MATIRDVARRAGVAISTASAAINRSAPVSVDVIAKVEEAVRAIGYVPNGAAQSLRSGQSRLVGLIVPRISNPHFAAVASTVEDVCLGAGYMSVVFSTGQDEDRESEVLRMMRHQRVSGLVFVPAQSSAEHGQDLMRQIQVPTVLLDMPVEGLGFNVVKLDNVRAARIATEHLLSMGHRRIAVLCGLPGLITSEDRLRGHADAMTAAGLSADTRLLLRGDFEQQRAFDSTVEALGRADAPTAIVALSNLMMIGALMAVRSLGLRVPQQVSLIGIGDLDFAEVVDPRPTVVSAPVAEMAERAIRLLLEELETKRKPVGSVEVFAPRLIQRGTCGPPPHS